MIVIIIIVAVTVLGGTRVFNPNENRKGLVRKLAVRVKEIRTSAKLQGSTFRLAIKMDEQEGDRYWVESASGRVLQMTEIQEKELDRLTESQKNDLTQGRAKFEKDDKRYKEVKLTSGLRFLSVEVAGRSQPISKGTAYISFFPEGLADEAVITMGDGKNQLWTIVVHPLTSGAQILERKTSLKELHEQ